VLELEPVPCRYRLCLAEQNRRRCHSQGIHPCLRNRCQRYTRWRRTGWLSNHRRQSITLVFGSYHDVDSNEMAFRTAASMGFKEGFMKANPVLLEPIMKVEVEVPEDFMGEVIGDISSRRGRVEGMETVDSISPRLRVQFHFLKCLVMLPTSATRPAVKVHSPWNSHTTKKSQPTSQKQLSPPKKRSNCQTITNQIAKKDPSRGPFLLPQN
jgi:hypothetical protein